jgi:hypothetical protein
MLVYHAPRKKACVVVSHHQLLVLAANVSPYIFDHHHPHIHLHYQVHDTPPDTILYFFNTLHPYIH